LSSVSQSSETSAFSVDAASSKFTSVMLVAAIVFF
jgi:hypothetical protein